MTSKQLRGHIGTERTSPIAVMLRCSCGWTREISRRQNALARAAKVRAAWAEHERQAEAEFVMAPRTFPETLSQALAALGIRHESGSVEGKRAWYDADGAHLGDYDAEQGWAEVERRRAAR